MSEERVTRDGIRYAIRVPDPELLAEIARLRAEHPTDRCDLFRTTAGRCTCERSEP